MLCLAEAEFGAESFCFCIGAGCHSCGKIFTFYIVVTAVCRFQGFKGSLLFQVSWPLLGIPLSLHTVTALVAICAAVVIYAQVFVTLSPLELPWWISFWHFTSP